ncbi:MAG: right-handed parallel beta-helix repeat-containing protein [Akkermansiaceae bacterium]
MKHPLTLLSALLIAPLVALHATEVPQLPVAAITTGAPEGLASVSADGEQVEKADPILYHVAMEGADANPGTSSAAPLRTIQAAVERMQPGDICTIRAGTYRETVVPPRDGTAEAPLVLRAAPGETVVLSGLDAVGNWERVDERTFRAAFNGDLGPGSQVFRDGKPLVEARWPNRAGDDPFNPEGATVPFEGSGIERLHCPDFPEGWTAETLAGSTVWCMAQWRWSSWTAPVVGYDPDTRAVLVKGHDNWWVKEQHNPGRAAPLHQGRPVYQQAEFFISNARALLDAPGEWFHDTGEGKLYLAVAPGDDPNRWSIEAKRRQTAVDLTGRANIHVQGIRVFGATITLKGARDCLVSGITAHHICHTRGGSTMTHVPGSEGIFISGSGNVLRDSEIAFSTGSGVTLHGSGNAMINCLVRETDTIASYACCVSLGGAGNLVSHNTLRDSGRDCLQFAGYGHLIQFNDVSGAGRICHDTGAIYQGGQDGGGTHIRYNWVHSVATTKGNGIYLDNYSHNYLVHHNVVWNISGNAVQINHPGHYNMVFHNTVYGSTASTYSPWQGRNTLFGTVLANNLLAREPLMKVDCGRIEAATVLHDAPPPVGGFDPARDLIPVGRDQGVPLPGINDGFMGTAPDAGAYEAGLPLWRAGHNFATSPQPVHEPTASFHRNYLTNGSFTLAPQMLPEGWSIVVGQAKVSHFPGFNYPDADDRFAVHGNSLCLSGEGEVRVEQTIADLPAGEFVFAAYVRSEGAPDVVLSVRTGAGEEVAAARYSSAEPAVWRQVTTTFRLAEPGPVTVAILKEGAGDAYVDDAGLAPTWQ